MSTWLLCYLFHLGADTPILEAVYLFYPSLPLEKVFEGYAWDFTIPVLVQRLKAARWSFTKLESGRIHALNKDGTERVKFDDRYKCSMLGPYWHLTIGITRSDCVLAFQVNSNGDFWTCSSKGNQLEKPDRANWLFETSSRRPIMKLACIETAIAFMRCPRQTWSIGALWDVFAF